jgi:LL-diaminopimelate aminotransferase
MDSGVPQAIQSAAIEALNGPRSEISRHNDIYQRRRDLIVETLLDMGLEVDTPKASLYVWAKVPKGYTSAGFATELLEQVGVVVTPGNGYGVQGEGYVRLSLTISDASLVKGLSKLATWKGMMGRSKSKS